MEKISSYLNNFFSVIFRSNHRFNFFSIIPNEIQQEIFAYLDISALVCFTITHKSALKNILPLLLDREFTVLQLKLAAGEHTTYYYHTDGLFVCGDYPYGPGINHSPMQKPTPTFTAIPLPGKLKQVSGGYSHSLILTEDNQLWACGNNNFGQLGLGTSSNFIGKHMSVPFPSKIKQVSLGGDSSFVVTEEGQVWACGQNIYGQLGLGFSISPISFTFISLPNKVKQVIPGKQHTLLLTEDQQLWACGDNGCGQLGLGHTEKSYTFQAVPFIHKIKQVAAGSSNSFIITEEGQLWGCGSNYEGELGLGHKNCCHSFVAIPTPNKVKQVTAGIAHTLILTEDNQLWVCGNNSYGQSGFERTKRNVLAFTRASLPGHIKLVVAGSLYTLVLTEDSQLWACGQNSCGQLGLGHTSPTETFTLVENFPPQLHKIISFSQYLAKLKKLADSIADNEQTDPMVNLKIVEKPAASATQFNVMLKLFGLFRQDVNKNNCKKRKHVEIESEEESTNEHVNKKSKYSCRII